VLTTEGALLNGRLRYRQPAEGFRSGIEPVLLAAAVPARAGERVLEAGSGAGPALLCLHARVPEVESVGIELDQDMAALAAENAGINGLTGMRAINGDILSVALQAPFDHAIANPPYHPPGPASPLAARERAKRDEGGVIQAWITRLAAALRPRGTLTVVLPSGSVSNAMEAMHAAGCGGLVLFPLWPRLGRDAKLLLVRGVRGSQTPLRIAAGLVLHEANGGFSAAAQAILRDGEGLVL
jgi:tRNA1Val (adenine37-N6)-methyltransferase